MKELVNYLHILILATFSLLIKQKFVLTTHNKEKKCFINVFSTSEFLSNFDLKNMILIFTKDLSWGKNDPNFARFSKFKLLDFYDKF
jgi:hypothetical protein